MLFDCIIPSHASQCSHSAASVRDVDGVRRKCVKGGVRICVSVSVRRREGVCAYLSSGGWCV
jgi:hypothetical protein